MGNKTENAQDILDRYIEEINPDPTSMDEVADWALTNGLFAPQPQDVRQMCKSMLSRAARSQKRFDGKRWYRAKHSVKSNMGGVQLVLWADIDKNASHSFMEKSKKQRRKNVVDDCFQMKMDYDHYNEQSPEQQLSPLVLDFTDDVAEKEAEQQLDDDKNVA